MCDVCIGEAALATTRCKSNKCAAFEDGYMVEWAGWAPNIPLKDHPRFRGIRRSGPRMKNHKLRRAFDKIPPPAVHVRARGKGPEWKPARYQIRLDGQPWPKEWTKTKDLAGTMGWYGFDVKWKYAPKLVQEWVLGKRLKAPTEEEIKKAAGFKEEKNGHGNGVLPRPLLKAVQLWGKNRKLPRAITGFKRRAR